MDTPQAVQTAKNCLQCDKPLPERPTAKEHRFCDPKCRANWHRAEKQRRLNHALELARICIVLADAGELPPLRIRLAEITMDLVKAGAEPS